MRATLHYRLCVVVLHMADTPNATPDREQTEPIEDDKALSFVYYFSIDTKLSA